MLYLVCPVVLLLVCLGSSLVDAFLSGSRLVIQNSNTAVVSGKSALNRLTIGHCKSWWVALGYELEKCSSQTWRKVLRCCQNPRYNYSTVCLCLRVSLCLPTCVCMCIFVYLSAAYSMPQPILWLFSSSLLQRDLLTYCWVTASVVSIRTLVRIDTTTSPLRFDANVTIVWQLWIENYLSKCSHCSRCNHGWAQYTAIQILDHRFQSTLTVIYDI